MSIFFNSSENNADVEELFTTVKLYRLITLRYRRPQCRYNTLRYRRNRLPTHTHIHTHLVSKILRTQHIFVYLFIILSEITAHGGLFLSQHPFVYIFLIVS